MLEMIPFLTIHFSYFTGIFSDFQVYPKHDQQGLTQDRECLGIQNNMANLSQILPLDGALFNLVQEIAARWHLIKY